MLIRNGRNRRKTKDRLCLVVSLFLLCCTSPASGDDQKGNENQSISEYQTLGLDPHAFKTAEGMYRVAESSAYDGQAAKLMAEIDSHLSGAGRLEIPRLRKLLVELNRYRNAAEVQEFILKLAEREAASRSAAKTPATAKGEKTAPGSAPALVDSADKLYTQGKFGDAGASYMKALLQDPLHFDARNNLALAEIQLGNDLIAQLQLEILRRLHKTYLPAMVNLTIVYERLGQTDKARGLAVEAGTIAKIPQTVYNQVWYRLLDREPPLKEGDLDLLKTVSSNQKYKDLHRQARKSAMEASSKSAPPALLSLKTLDGAKWQGIVGLFGKDKKTWLMAVAFVPFLIVTIILIRMCGKARRRPGYCFFFFGTLWFVAYLGIPNHRWGFFILACYVLIGTRLAISSKR